MHYFPAHKAADIRRAPAPARTHVARRVVTEWSESCACGGNFLGHEEEPCRPDCTGCYPVRWGSGQQSGEAMCPTCRFMNRWLHLCDRTRWSRETCACREDHSLERLKV